MSKKLYYKTALGVVSIVCYSLLAGCGFRTLSPHDIPPPLRNIYVDTKNPYAPLVVQLKRMLTSLKVRMVNSPQAAPVTLRISDIKTDFSMPPIIYSGNATAYTYSLAVTIELTKKNGSLIYGPNKISISRSLLQNVNQVYVPNADMLMQRDLTRNMVTIIYNRITSRDVQKALHKAFSKRN